jgi:hemerythrin
MGVTMAVITWNESLSVNVREIDEQHKKLVGLIADLHQAMLAGQGKQALGQVLNGLISYTNTHFAAEERLLKANGYPEFEGHHNIHLKMVEKVKDIQNRHSQGRLNISLDTMKFLEDWITKHIMGTDKKYGPFLNSKGVF